jgi:ferric iron reductase protein FhuF
VQAVAVLSDVSGLGPFFTVRTDRAESADPSWRPVAGLETDGPLLRDRIDYVRRALGGDDRVELRVAASIAFQGIAAVIVSPPYAAAVLHCVVPALGPDVLHWRDRAGGPLPLWADAPAATAVDTAEEAAATLGELYAEHLPALVAAVRSVVAVSERVLWGNVASVVAGAKRMVAVGRPGAATRAADVAARLLDAGPLAGGGDRLAPAAPDRHWTFRRRSCCLFYRVEGGGYCGDCVLAGR